MPLRYKMFYYLYAALCWVFQLMVISEGEAVIIDGYMEELWGLKASTIMDLKYQKENSCKEE